MLKNNHPRRARLNALLPLRLSLLPFYWLLLALCLNGCSNESRPTRLQLGDRFPTFHLQDLKGQSVTGPNHTGRRPQLINIRAIGCQFCGDDLALLETVQQKYQTTGLRLNMIVTGFNDIDVRNYLSQQTPVSFPILNDPDMQVLKQCRALSLPATYLLDGQGRLLAQHYGALKNSVLITRLETLLTAP